MLGCCAAVSVAISIIVPSNTNFSFFIFFKATVFPVAISVALYTVAKPLHISISYHPQTNPVPISTKEQNRFVGSTLLIKSCTASSSTSFLPANKQMAQIPVPVRMKVTTDTMAFASSKQVISFGSTPACVMSEYCYTYQSRNNADNF